MPKGHNHSNLPGKPEPFGDWFKSFNHFIQNAPVKGFLENIDEFFREPLFPQSAFYIKVHDMEDMHLVTATLPGVKKEQISIGIVGNNLTINVKSQDIFIEEDDKNHIYRRSESTKRFSRTIAIPIPFDERQIKASYRDGLLKISIPKQKGKQIDIID